MADSIQTIAGYIALAVPATVAITNLAKLALEWLNQRHALITSRIDQAHQITSHYLNKALDPNVPLAIRHQLLRFLATPDDEGLRLSNWARSELARVEVIIDETNKAVEIAEQELLKAATGHEIAAAERKLALASSKKSSLLEPPKIPTLSVAALKAELIEEKELAGLVMKDVEMKGVRLLYRNLQSSNFCGSDLSDANFQGSDLRGADFTRCSLVEVNFLSADLRGAVLKGADLTKADLRKARLESADLSEAKLDNARVQATYDDTTKWPVGFDPKKNGAVHME